MRVDVMVETTIRVPRDVVASFAGDPSNAPTWYVNIRSARWVTEPPATVGSRVAFVARFLGRELSYTYEIVQSTPSETLVMRTAEGPFPMETSYRWEDTAGGHTRMTLRNRGTPRGFSRMLAPVMAHAMKRAMSKDLRALKQLLEQAG